MLKWVKATENGLDYSLMKTARSALFLVNPREHKFKALAAIETIFVRAGDLLAAGMVWMGTAFVPLTLEGVAAVNVAVYVPSPTSVVAESGPSAEPDTLVQTTVAPPLPTRFPASSRPVRVRVTRE